METREDPTKLLSSDMLRGMNRWDVFKYIICDAMAQTTSFKSVNGSNYCRSLSDEPIAGLLAKFEAFGIEVLNRHRKDEHLDGTYFIDWEDIERMIMRNDYTMAYNRIHDVIDGKIMPNVCERVALRYFLGKLWTKQDRKVLRSIIFGKNGIIDAGGQPRTDPWEHFDVSRDASTCQTFVAMKRNKSISVDQLADSKKLALTTVEIHEKADKVEGYATWSRIDPAS